MNFFTSEDGVGQEDTARVIELASEPSYISEIARKLVKHDPDWELGMLATINKVSAISGILAKQGRVEMITQDYSIDGMGQSESSPKSSLVDLSEEEGHHWNPHTIIHFTEGVTVRDEYVDLVDQEMSIDEKRKIVENLSNSGNEISKNAELIMQDVMERQFKHYDNTESPHYNDPGVDFHVEDEDQREWGLCVEVSTRFVNPVDRPYLEHKKQEAFERDSDLVIMAPKFTDELLDEYEDPDSPGWHDDPLSDMVHLHRVPPKEPTVYYPFAMRSDEINNKSGLGNPVIVADSESSRERLSNTGNVGDNYPIVDDDYGLLIESLAYVNRDFTVISESQYRNSLREALEPLLWNFLKPYKIEQFLQQMYWDESLTQGEIGDLVDRSSGTISDWMQKWGVMRRGSGAPELSDETVEIWSRMYRGEDPFPEEFSGYRIQAEYNRRPLWGLDEWEKWYEATDEEERKGAVADQSSYSESITYTLMYGPEDRLQPSYSFVLKTLKEEGVEIRPPDEAPRGAYSAYPSKTSLEYMINVNEETIVDVGEDGS